jgi:hypothetical protein
MTETTPSLFPEYDVDEFQAITETPFDRFWAAFPRCPRKVGKAKCAKRFASVPQKYHSNLMAALDVDKDSEWWSVRGRVPLPYTWLNQQRWLDPAESGREEPVRAHANGEPRCDAPSAKSPEDEALIAKYMEANPNSRLWAR